MICYVCGKRLVDAMGRPVNGVDRTIDGNPVKLHDVCSRTFDRDNNKLTAIVSRGGRRINISYVMNTDDGKMLDPGSTRAYTPPDE